LSRMKMRKVHTHTRFVALAMAWFRRVNSLTIANYSQLQGGLLNGIGGTVVVRFGFFYLHSPLPAPIKTILMNGNP